LQCHLMNCVTAESNAVLHVHNPCAFILSRIQWAARPNFHRPLRFRRSRRFLSALEAWGEAACESAGAICP
jgi:hypothetical protein